MNGPGENLIARIDAALREGTAPEITARIQGVLEELARAGAIELPPAFHEPCPDRYARRLLHRDPATGYTIVVMTWGPGQQTPLHDHAGMWCVECVVLGGLDVLQYDVVERVGDRFRFEQRRTVAAGVGDAGRLIPPFEYHVLRNPRPDRVAISLHVYAGEMDHCNVYVAGDDGWWERSPRPLVYAE